jgi:hypothetical protein
MWEIEQLLRPKRFGRYSCCISHISPTAGEIWGTHGRGRETLQILTNTYEMLFVTRS